MWRNVSRHVSASREVEKERETESPQSPSARYSLHPFLRPGFYPDCMFATRIPLPSAPGARCFLMHEVETTIHYSIRCEYSLHAVRLAASVWTVLPPPNTFRIADNFFSSHFFVFVASRFYNGACVIRDHCQRNTTLGGAFVTEIAMPKVNGIAAPIHLHFHCREKTLILVETEAKIDERDSKREKMHIETWNKT